MSSRLARAAAHRQGGVIIVLFALMLLVLLALAGLAVDLPRVYTRQQSLQSMVDAAALAAVRGLDGSSAGIERARTNAMVAVNDRFNYGDPYADIFSQPGHPAAPWRDAALSFAAAPDGPWLDLASARAAPAALHYARIDSAALDSAISPVQFFLLALVPGVPASLDVTVQAVAGNSAQKVTPFGLCALSPVPNAARNNPATTPAIPASVELVQYGFRRGVPYDLMQLNPSGTTPANFVLNPLDPPGAAARPDHLAPSVVAPFVCMGRVLLPSVMAGPVQVAQPFPLAALYRQFNTRFDQYQGSGCDPLGSPPDTNIQAYRFDGPQWMQTPPRSQAAASYSDGQRLVTVADPLPNPAGTMADQYGLLWSFSRAIPYAAYLSYPDESKLPAARGYTGFTTLYMQGLYNPGKPWTGLPHYPSPQPYYADSIADVYHQAPQSGHRPTALRRVLNIPLLACPVPASGRATVLAIRRFFMPVPATATSLVGEFVGVAPEFALSTSLELVR